MKQRMAEKLEAQSPSGMEPVRYVERESGEVVREERGEDAVLSLIYGPGLFSRIVRHIVRRHLISRLYGWYFDRPVRQQTLLKFAKRFRIDIEEASEPLSQYRTKNELFVRKLKPSARPINREPRVLISPADSHLLIFPGITDQRLPLKGGSFTLEELLRDRELAATFRNADVAIFRLAPADYHRFHFPAEGVAMAPRRIDGWLDSVSVIAIRRDPTIYCRNQRALVHLENELFGRMLLMPVGATMVGTIVHSYQPGKVQRGDEMGYFRVGGSAMVMILEPGRVQFDEDLLHNSAQGLETKVKFGTRIAMIA